MNNQETIANLNMISVAFVEPVTKEQRKLIDDTFDNAIKALKQEPCEDAISRQAVIDACEQSINILEAVDRIMDLPSVKQEPKTEQEDDYFRKIVEVAISQLRADRDRLEDELAKREQEPKTGHWMIVHRKGIYTHLVCDKCLSNAPYDCRTNYCPNCGCRMVEPQERSDKE